MILRGIRMLINTENKYKIIIYKKRKFIGKDLCIFEMEQVQKSLKYVKKKMQKVNEKNMNYDNRETIE